MSYISQNSRLVEFVPNYVVHSDYLPSNKVVDGHQTEVAPVLRQYEIERAKGHVYTQRPAEFNPQRYISVRTYENVKVNQPISQEQFQRLLKR